MSSAKGIFLLVTMAAAFSVADGWWWNWDFEWSTEEPANCPHRNNQTNVCSTLDSTNATCITIKCCDEFAADEESNEYEYDDMSESEDDNVYSIGTFYDSCRMCYKSAPCSVYKCYTRCCDGYQWDSYGRCRNKTNHIQCKNGGSLYGDRCSCPQGFAGTSCEIPQCQCENGGECVVKDGRPFCNCSYGHFGERCENSRCTMKCENGGVCYKNGTYEFCRCPQNYVGKSCEEYFVQHATCPTPEYRHPYCASYCTKNSDCGDEEVCCKEGCTTICRKPKAEYCEVDGRRFRIGQSFSPDPCKNCTCTIFGTLECSSMSCRHVEICPDGRRPETRPGECCPSCPDKPSYQPPKILGCPTGILNVNTTYYQDSAMLSERNTFIHAYDANSRAIPVKFTPDVVRHSRCKNPQKKTTFVQAYATDIHGNIAKCTFKVAVWDIYAPVFRDCPEDIYVFEKEVVQWREPSYFDNVGVAYKTCSSEKNGVKFTVGDYPMTYQIWDYDKNTAYCRFHVSVVSDDTDFEKMPQGLRDRSKDKSRIMLIVGPLVGAVIFIILLVAFFLCCRRNMCSRDRNARAPARQTPAYDNNIYATPGDINVKLPPYSDLPMNPPAYSITGSEKDIAYISLAPPSYTNPGYETLKVHLKRSESDKSQKSDKDAGSPEKSEESDKDTGSSI